ncbi:MAG: hypothetical protein Q8O67_33080 [Deltaproteobacteria bacterium]|nr:hypothetical protein [Deltaproteobacteria bacterium]
MRTLVVVAVVFGTLVSCSVESPVSGPTWNRDIAPVIMEQCVNCHRPGGIAPFSLLSYDEVVANQDLIVFSVTNRWMPPWNLDNSGECKSYQQARWLDDEEIALISGWVAAGSPRGEPATREWTSPEPDALDDDAVYLEMAEPYTPTPQPGFPSDDFRCFFLEPGNARDAYVTGFELFPGAPQEVHHMLLFSLLNSRSEAEAQALDDEDDVAGWPCFAGAGPGIEERDILLAAVWAPGTNVMRYPAQTGLLIPGSHRMVMQVHYDLFAGPVPDLTGIKVALADTVEHQAALVPLSDESFELPPREPVVGFNFSHPFAGLSEPLVMYGLFPHMHTLGQTLRVTKRTIDDDGDGECLGDVQRWDFSWQEIAFYDEPTIINPSEELDVRCTWDTSDRAATTVWGEAAEEEMCLVYIYVSRANGGPLSDVL